MVYLTQGRVNVFSVQRLSQEFKGKLVNFQCGDYLLLSGNTVLNCLAVAILLAKHEEVTVLIFNALTRQYIPREISRREIT